MVRFRGWHRASAKEKGQQTRRYLQAGNGPKTAFACGWAKHACLALCLVGENGGSGIPQQPCEAALGGRVPSQTRTQCLLQQCHRASALRNDAGFPGLEDAAPGRRSANGQAIFDPLTERCSCDLPPPRTSPLSAFGPAALASCAARRVSRSKVLRLLRVAFIPSWLHRRNSLDPTP